MLPPVVFKIVQNQGAHADSLRGVQPLSPDLYGRPLAASGPAASLVRLFRRSVGRRQVRRHHIRFQRPVVARRHRTSARRNAEDDRALPSHRLRSHGNASHRRGPENVSSRSPCRCRSICSRIPNSSRTSAKTSATPPRSRGSKEASRSPNTHPQVVVTNRLLGMPHVLLHRCLDL